MNNPANSSRTSSKRFWAELSTAEFAGLDLARTIAVLPLGATEQHGPHLPLDVDSRLVDGVVQAALPALPVDLPVLFLPTQSLGLSPEHSGFAGTLTLKAATVIALWTEIAECVAKAGVRKLLLLNAHGGQVGLLDVVGRDLRARLNMLVYSASWFNLPMDAASALFSAEEHRFGIHGGDIETSMMLALAPQRVDMAKAENFASASQARAKNFPILGNGRSAKLAWATQDYNPAGAVGNAANATAEKGRALLDAAGQALAKLLVEIDSLPADTLVAPPLT